MAMTHQNGAQDAVADLDRVMEVKTNGDLITYPCDG
jgi:hypothetical protein